MPSFRFRSAVVAAMLLLFATGSVKAEYIFSLDPADGVDLQSLYLGQVIPLYVNVSGMTGDDSILLFHFTENFPGGMFLVQSVEAGASIPDASAFTGNFSATDFEVEYTGATPVTLNGILAKVTLLVAGGGGGTFDLHTQLAIGQNTGIDLEGMTPSFTISPGPAPVPEPSSLALAAVGLAAAVLKTASTRGRGVRTSC